MTRAKEWLERLASRHLDRSELTPSFSAYLSDDLIARENFAALGPVQSIVPISSSAESNGDTLYEFLVRYPHAQYHYQFEVTHDGKIDGLNSDCLVLYSSPSARRRPVASTTLPSIVTASARVALLNM